MNTFSDRLFSNTIPEPNTGCLFWLGATDRKGYPRIWDAGRNTIGTKRLLEITIGRNLFAEEVTRHKCDVPCCVNIKHLIIGTQKDNIQDAIKKNRMATGLSNGASIYSEAQINEVRGLWERGFPKLTISQITGMSRRHIIRIINRDVRCQ